MKIRLMLVTVLLNFCFFPNLNVASARAEKVTVAMVSGAPEIIRQGRSLPASLGMACQKDDILKTTLSSSMEIAMNQVAGCRVLAQSECMISSATPKNMHLVVANGNVILNLKKLPRNSTFKVETPTAIAAVRGTQFWGRVDHQKIDDPVTTFAVREGVVEIFAKTEGKTYRIEKGQALDIPKSTVTTPAVRSALAEELAAMEQAASIKTKS